MPSFLVVAHKTLVERRLLDEVAERARSAPSRIHLLVPMAAPAAGSWTYGSVEAAAIRRLHEGLEAFRARDLECDGEVGDGRPVDAVQQVLRRGDVRVDEVILSTLPPGVSRWLPWDVPGRLAKAIAPIPVHHVVAERLPTPA